MSLLFSPAKIGLRDILYSLCQEILNSCDINWL